MNTINSNPKCFIVTCIVAQIFGKSVNPGERGSIPQRIYIVCVNISIYMKVLLRLPLWLCQSHYQRLQFSVGFFTIKSNWSDRKPCEDHLRSIVNQITYSVSFHTQMQCHKVRSYHDVIFLKKTETVVIRFGYLPPSHILWNSISLQHWYEQQSNWHWLRCKGILPQVYLTDVFSFVSPASEVQR